MTMRPVSKLHRHFIRPLLSLIRSLSTDPWILLVVCVSVSLTLLIEMYLVYDAEGRMRRFSQKRGSREVHYWSEPDNYCPNSRYDCEIWYNC